MFLKCIEKKNDELFSVIIHTVHSVQCTMYPVYIVHNIFIVLATYLIADSLLNPYSRELTLATPP
jgi:hypothetical protein